MHASRIALFLSELNSGSVVRLQKQFWELAVCLENMQ